MQFSGQHWIERFRALPLNKKIKLYLIIGITLISGSLLAISSSVSIAMLNKRSRDLTNANIDNVAESMNVLAGNFKGMMQSLIPDDAVQNWLKADKKDEGYADFTTESRYILSLSSAIRDNINFIGLYKNQGEYIYRGVAINKSNYSACYRKDFEQSVQWGKGDLRISYGNTYFTSDEYTLTFYQPVYDMNRIGRQIGMLCINVDDSILDILKTQEIGNSYLQLYLVQTNGNMIFAPDKEKTGTFLDLSLTGNSGSYTKGKDYWVYRKIKNSNVYVVGQISNAGLLRYSIVTFSLLLITILAIAVNGVVFASWGVKKTYAPMERLVGYMKAVSDGNLDIRINEHEYGEDLVAISCGFNHMLDSINQLMEQVKQEQLQSAQIRMNALQEQIKPHFLYNALDCIHWKALACGNQDISDLVKALANYYRISLSGGRDIISLKEELDCIKNYIVLQNMRYQDLVVLESLPEQKYNAVSIPKLTLQPLIENCIYHGVQNKNADMTVHIIVKVHEEINSLVLEVADDGVGMEKEKRDELNHSLRIQDGQIGYGVRNVHRRLRLLFGEEYGLYYKENVLGGTTVEVRLPKSAAQKDENRGN